VGNCDFNAPHTHDNLETQCTTLRGGQKKGEKFSIGKLYEVVFNQVDPDTLGQNVLEGTKKEYNLSKTEGEREGVA